MRHYALKVMLCMSILLLVGCGDGTTPTEDPGGTAPPMPAMLTGNTTTLAGDGTQAVQDSTDGTGATAQFNFPRGITTDGTSLFLSESTGDRIRTIDPTTGETTTLAGGGPGTQDSTDGNRKVIAELVA